MGKQLTSGCRPWLNNVAWLNSLISRRRNHEANVALAFEKLNCYEKNDRRQ